MNATMISPPLRRGVPTAAPLNPIPRFFRTAKGLLLLVFVPLLVLAARAAGWETALRHVGIAVGAACLVELLALEQRKLPWRFPSSALLSGLIVAFVLGPETPPLITLIVGALATASKHLIATRRGHLFNPAALALLVSVPVFATDQSWWGALPDLPWPWLIVLLAGGTFVADRINKLPLVLSFLAAYFGIFTIAAVFDPVRVSEMFRTPFVQAALFLAFFMLTDPPTSPSRTVEQVWIGILVAGVSCLAQLVGAGQTYLLIGLLAGNLALAVSRSIRRSAAATPSEPPLRPTLPASGDTLVPVVAPGAATDCPAAG
jgi:Na+-translocating ferredoxin:NAD+ oxidoreductase RnfD subunit